MAISYLWSTGETTPTINVNPTETTTYTLTVTADDGQTAMATKTVNVHNTGSEVKSDIEELDLPPISETLVKFTQNALEGNGVFDVIMHACELHIHDEYDKNRISGANYSSTYIQTIQAVLQTATQLVLQGDKAYLEALQARYNIERTKAELAIAKVQLEQAKTQLEIAKLQIPLIKYQALAEQAKTCDIIDSGEPTYAGATSNIHGLFGAQLATSAKALDTQIKNDALQLAKELVVSPFNIIESADGAPASNFGLNGGNGISILNNLREAYGITPLDTETYSGAHKQYMDKYAPGATVEDDTE